MYESLLRKMAFIDVCSPSSDSYTLSPLSKPLASSFPRSSSSRVLRLNIQEKSRRSSMVKAVYLDGFSASGTSERTCVWSIRDDLTMPSSPHFPVQAQGPSGPSPMVQERFQSVISQLFQYDYSCGGAVDDDMDNIIVGQLLYLDAVNPNKVFFISMMTRIWRMCLKRGTFLPSSKESALTGESLPVTKNPGDAVYSGSTCKQGEIEAIVIATGVNTFFGHFQIQV